MSFVVLYDANVLYPSTLRDLLIRVAQAGLVQAKWTDQILDEVFGNIATNRPDLDPQRLARTRELMNRAVRDCFVTDYEPLVDALDLPDPDDRHVLAAAIKARAQVIVTHNLKDFPSTVLEEWDMEAKSADDFILDRRHRPRCQVLGEFTTYGASGDHVAGGDQLLDLAADVGRFPSGVVRAEPLECSLGEGIADPASRSASRGVARVTSRGRSTASRPLDESPA